jgi:hypothetical protein
VSVMFMVTVEVVVGEGQKSDWRTFVEETEEGRKYDSVSDLVRTAVESQIARDLGEEGVPDEIEDKLYDILDEFGSLQAKMEMANEALDNIENNQLSEEDVDDVVDFHREMIEDELERLDGSDSNEDGGSDA